MLAALRGALAADDPVIRGHAVWAAARLGRHDLVPGTDADPHVAAELAAVAAGTVPARTARSAAVPARPPFRP